MKVRTIRKDKLLELVNNYNWDPIPKEVVNYWLCIWGSTIEIEPETRAEENEAKESACAQSETKEQENNDNKVEEEH